MSMRKSPYSSLGLGDRNTRLTTRIASFRIMLSTNTSPGADLHIGHVVPAADAHFPLQLRQIRCLHMNLARLGARSSMQTGHLKRRMLGISQNRRQPAPAQTRAGGGTRAASGRRCAPPRRRPGQVLVASLRR